MLAPWSWHSYGTELGRSEFVKGGCVTYSQGKTDIQAPAKACSLAELSGVCGA